MFPFFIVLCFCYTVNGIMPEFVLVNSLSSCHFFFSFIFSIIFIIL